MKITTQMKDKIEKYIDNFEYRDYIDYSNKSTSFIITIDKDSNINVKFESNEKNHDRNDYEIIYSFFNESEIKKMDLSEFGEFDSDIYQDLCDPANILIEDPLDSNEFDTIIEYLESLKYESYLHQFIELRNESMIRDFISQSFDNMRIEIIDNIDEINNFESE